MLKSIVFLHTKNSWIVDIFIFSRRMYKYKCAQDFYGKIKTKGNSKEDLNQWKYTHTKGLEDSLD